ncbi:MAG: 16S rRNA (uracil(1498)-N(3))-methyltransferase [Phycisphaeraceae bacterium]|nr:16S rRNA (uracil(1498)-N(3))-methyltransferase [Phycisphaeraceae bacterium]
MHRFYDPNFAAPLAADPSAHELPVPPPEPVWLDQDEARHALRVLRLRPGEPVEIFNGQGLAARGDFLCQGRDAGVKLTSLRHTPRPMPTLTLAVAMPKGPRVDQLVSQLTQLGVDTLVPLLTERTVVDPGQSKLDRLRKLVIESAKQCGRDWLMDIAPPTTFSVLLTLPRDLLLIADPLGRPLDAHTTQQAAPSPHSLLVLVGPEGGLTPDETELAIAAGGRPWRFASHILRIETAAVAAAALLRNAWPISTETQEDR